MASNIHIEMMKKDDSTKKNGQDVSLNGTRSRDDISNGCLPKIGDKSEDNCNLRCSQEKSCSLYGKFPEKINNNNVYHNSVEGKECGDGMNDYLLQNVAVNSSHQQPQLSSEELNSLDGNDEEEENEDDEDNGCIYTYKGDSGDGGLGDDGFHLCHLCGLPSLSSPVLELTTQSVQNNSGDAAAVARGNVFSPDMDFLEMDFDPGPNDGHSDCDENSDQVCSGSAALGGIHRSLSSSDNCDDRCNVNVVMNAFVCQWCRANMKEVNIMPPSCLASATTDNRDEMVLDITDTQSGCNNLNVPKCDSIDQGVVSTLEITQCMEAGEMLQRGDLRRDENDDESSENENGGDVEGGMSGSDADDSNSDVVSTGSLEETERCSGERGCESSWGNNESRPANNNLGSQSAPEVSPAQECDPTVKFGRSVSFHNQLSSPKYENVCFSSRLESRTGGLAHGTCEGANLEACVGRLCSRENAVFNISCENTSNCQNVESPTRRINVANDVPINNNNSISNDVDLHQNPLALPPLKFLRPKITDLSQDPNTASEADTGDAEEENEEDIVSRLEKTMIWTEKQATTRQVSQVGTSACGATAVINVLLALDMSTYSAIEIQNAVRTQLRKEDASVVDYLLSRSVAGSTHEDLMEGVKVLTAGHVKGRFFGFFPKRAVQLSRWLGDWIAKGGVPVSTLNLQLGVAQCQTTPDAWHHQMIFGVGPRGIYLTNPLECVSSCVLGEQLCSERVLMVRRRDVENRWNGNDSLARLTMQEDRRWNDMNVLGQVVNILKEQVAPPVMQGRRHLTSHVVIPAAYHSGITIFMRDDNANFNELFFSSDLPLME